MKRTRPGPALEALKRRAMTVLRQKRMYEQQRDTLYNQQFNMEQTRFQVRQATCQGSWRRKGRPTTTPHQHDSASCAPCLWPLWPWAAAVHLHACIPGVRQAHTHTHTHTHTRPPTLIKPSTIQAHHHCMLSTHTSLHSAARTHNTLSRPSRCPIHQPHHCLPLPQVPCCPNPPSHLPTPPPLRWTAFRTQ